MPILPGVTAGPGADTHLGEAAQLALALDPCPFYRAHVMVATCAARAYLVYAQDKWYESLATLVSANEAALMLLDRGERWIHLHRIQLLHNWARVEIARGASGRGLALASSILDHIQGLAPRRFPLDGPWTPDLVTSCPAEMIAALAFQVAGEMTW